MRGKIIKGIGGFYYIATDTGIIETKAKGIFRLGGITPTIGDDVLIEMDSDGTGMISEIFPRKNKMIRPPVANVDQILVVSSIDQPMINPWLIDKIILLAFHNEITPKICINKIDLDIESAKKYKEEYTKSGFDVFLCSTFTGEGIDELKDHMVGLTTALAGPSGVGKSSIINIMAEVDFETGIVSDKTKRGKHTTRHVEMIKYGSDSYILDTPGFSSLELDFIEDASEIKSLYPEFVKNSSKCKFMNCNHYKEPGCEIKKLVELEEIPQFRYDNYISFYDSIMDRRKY
ncbi:MAG: ribosome small subunit-dependent GTPase A [Tissierellia bacterium]|nr:ribosome small subunit-dependent GTPase A [Tissierellia bacterium]